MPTYEENIIEAQNPNHACPYNYYACMLVA